MTNSECVEVAETVWGWELRTVDAGFISTKVTIKVWYRNGKRTKWIESNTKDLVNSWQGFGRTVEAMSKRITSGFEKAKMNKAYTQFLLSEITKEELFEATHLAALEAVMEEK